MALVVGFMLSVMLAFVLEYTQSILLVESSDRKIEASLSGTPGFESGSPSASRRQLAGS